MTEFIIYIIQKGIVKAIRFAKVTCIRTLIR